jgi:hypothetical protein
MTSSSQIYCSNTTTKRKRKGQTLSDLFRWTSVMKKYRHKQACVPCGDTDLAKWDKTAPTHVIRFVCRRFAARCTWDWNFFSLSRRGFLSAGVPCLHKRLGFSGITGLA